LPVCVRRGAGTKARPNPGLEAELRRREEKDRLLEGADRLADSWEGGRTEHNAPTAELPGGHPTAPGPASATDLVKGLEAGKK